MTNQLHVRFEGPRVMDDGVPLDDLQKTFYHIQRAVRFMVSHLSGIAVTRGRPPKLVREQSSMRLLRTSPGSLVAELELSRPPLQSKHRKEDGLQAIDAILSWEGENDHRLPPKVANELLAVGEKLSQEIESVLLQDQFRDRTLVLRSTKVEHARDRSNTVDAFLQGQLLEVNWSSRTAQLHRYQTEYVPLRFEASLDESMQHLARQFVEIKGTGRLSGDGVWKFVHVNRVSETRSWSEPFDSERFLSDPSPKVFSTENMVVATDPFDVDDFIRIIHEGRDV